MFTASADCARVERHMAVVSLGQLLLSPLLPLLLPLSSELLQSRFACTASCVHPEVSRTAPVDKLDFPATFQRSPPLHVETWTPPFTQTSYGAEKQQRLKKKPLKSVSQLFHLLWRHVCTFRLHTHINCIHVVLLCEQYNCQRRKNIAFDELFMESKHVTLAVAWLCHFLLSAAGERCLDISLDPFANLSVFLHYISPNC